jgi:hypothetical protein
MYIMDCMEFLNIHRTTVVVYINEPMNQDNILTSHIAFPLANFKGWRYSPHTISGTQLECFVRPWTEVLIFQGANRRQMQSS